MPTMNTSSRSLWKWVPKVLTAAGAAASVLFGLAACGTFDQTARYQGNVVATGAANVATCKYMGELSGHSGLTGLFAPKGVDNVKQSLLKQADAMGATHVVWADSSAMPDNTSLTGKAYACPATAR